MDTVRIGGFWLEHFDAAKVDPNQVFGAVVLPLPDVTVRQYLNGALTAEAVAPCRSTKYSTLRVVVQHYGPQKD